MKYLALLYADESKTPPPGSPEMNQILEAYGQFFQEITPTGVMVGGDPVQASSTSTTVRNRNGSVERTPGPFSPTGDQVIGFYLFECASDDEAIGWAAKIPAAQSGAVEVRPILVQE
jgi:hypothetical protein